MTTSSADPTTATDAASDGQLTAIYDVATGLADAFAVQLFESLNEQGIDAGSTDVIELTLKIASPKLTQDEGGEPKVLMCCLCRINSQGVKVCMPAGCGSSD